MSNVITEENTLTFPLGRVFMTPGAIEALEDADQQARDFINRHSQLALPEKSFLSEKSPACPNTQLLACRDSLEMLTVDDLAR